MVFLKRSILVLVAIIIIAPQIFAQDNVISAFEKSYTLEKSGDYKKATNELKKVYSSESYEINLRLGWLEYNAGLFVESAAHYQKAINLKPYSEEAKFGIIYPKSAQGKWSEVIKLYEEIITNAPSNTTALYRLGLVYYGEKKYDKAGSYFKKVIDLYPFDYDGLLMYAWTNVYLGKNREAKVLFNKVLMNTPNDESALSGLEMLN